jgi:hypothetical protein
MATRVTETIQRAAGKVELRVRADDGAMYRARLLPYPNPEHAPVEGYLIRISHASELAPDVETAERRALEMIERIRRTP